MYKKGLSTVITSMILILLSLVAVGIVWVVIRNVITETVDDISISSVVLDLDVKSFIDNGGEITVRVKRNVGEGDITGLAFVISDGINSEIIEVEDVDLKELGEGNFLLNYDGLVKDISVAPIFLTESGRNKIGRESNKLTYKDKDVVKNIDNLVGWWKFDGNARDEVGNNHGILNGGVDCNINGKYGRACYFDGVDDNITIYDSVSLKQDNNWTIEGWIKSRETKNQDKIAIGKMGWHGGIIHQDGGIDFHILDNAGVNTEISYATTFGEWYHYVATYKSDNGEMNFYVNGNSIGTNTFIGTMNNYLNTLCIGGSQDSSYHSPVDVDEVMIFNKTLNAREVRALYNLNLS